jgi:hypothetical protein
MLTLFGTGGRFLRKKCMRDKHCKPSRSACGRVWGCVGVGAKWGQKRYFLILRFFDEGRT